MKKFFGNVFAVVLGNILTTVLIFLVIGILVFFSLAGSLFQGNKLKDGSVLEITFENPIRESTMEDEFDLLGMSSSTNIYYRDIIRSIEAAASDDKIKGISLKVESFSGGSAQLTDIRDALANFKKSGKFIYAYSHNSSQGSYIINSVADSIFQNPMGMVMLQGLSAEVMFFKNLGDKYGIDFQVIRHGAYKSAVEPYLRDDLSPENREQLTLLLNDIWKNLSVKVAGSRKLTEQQINEYTDSLYSFNSTKALQYKLVDKIAAESEYDQALVNRLKIEVKKDELMQDALDKYTIAIEDYAQELSSESGKDEIAVLYATGAIMPGEGYSGIQSDIYKKQIRELKNDDKVKAVVLRINSPGGSADAAEEILFELRELHKKKPIIVSFGDVAASGGYYIAMEADSIFASPNTITGSIGVLGMVPSFQKMANNFGITTDRVKTNQNSDFLKSPLQPMSETGMKVMTNMTESVYQVFVNHVMKGRKMNFAQVDSIGGGRVWSGTQALKIGLIDKFGTLDDAIKAAASKAGIQNYSVDSYPVKKNDLETFLKDMGFSKTEVYLREELGEENYQIFNQLKAIRENKGIQLRMPFDLKIK